MFDHSNPNDPIADDYSTDDTNDTDFIDEPEEADDGDCYDDYDPPEDQFRDDVEADADTLASAGFGTDEDYGHYGGDDGDYGDW